MQSAGCFSGERGSRLLSWGGHGRFLQTGRREVGAEGNQATGTPRLVGLQEWYLVKQMMKFRTGLRGNEPQDNFGQQMLLAAKALPNKQAIHDIAAYIMTLKADPLPRTAKTETPLESTDLFWHCTHCHGSKGQGINEGYTRNPSALHPPAPKLAGQHGWYSTRQIQNFKSRIRGSQLEDKEGTQCRVRGCLTYPAMKI